MDHRSFWGPEVFHGILQLVFLIAIIALVVWVVMQLRHGPAGRGSPPPPPGPDPALERVRMRYASGEITREEFEHLSEDLRRTT
jgi:putative membrane protein